MKNLIKKVNMNNNYKKARDFLTENLISEYKIYFGNPGLQWIDYVVDAWMDDQSNSKWRYELINDFVKLNKGDKILDMASGCGTFVFYGLLNDYDVFGIEPEEWKNEFNRMKIELYDYPKKWSRNFIRAFGEDLPFEDEFFDVVSSYQTIEHVSDVKVCLDEMLRVLKKGGMLFLHFPDYRSSFEAHYRLPWIPLFPKPLARVYLRMLKKPILGLDHINYVTKKNIIHLFQQNDQIEITDMDKIFFRKRTESIINKFNLFKIGCFGKALAVMGNLIYTYIYMPLRRAFRCEKSVMIIVRKL